MGGHASRHTRIHATRFIQRDGLVNQPVLCVVGCIVKRTGATAVCLSRCTAHRAKTLDSSAAINRSINRSVGRFVSHLISTHLILMHARQACHSRRLTLTKLIARLTASLCMLVTLVLTFSVASCERPRARRREGGTAPQHDTTQKPLNGSTAAVLFHYVSFPFVPCRSVASIHFLFLFPFLLSFIRTNTQARTCTSFTAVS